jgi:alkylhydroperoxidase family enzyme
MTQRLDYTTVAAGMKTLGGVYGYVSRSGLPASLIDLVYLRVSQINGCAYWPELTNCARLTHKRTNEEHRLIGGCRKTHDSRQGLGSMPLCDLRR